jgi:hypothetical protein
MSMAELLRALEPDRLTRAVWVVVDPRDAVTGARVTLPLEVRLRRVDARPIFARSGVYCFTDLNLPAATYTVDVEPGSAAAAAYFPAARDFTLKVPGGATPPLDRNAVTVELLPRPAYPFGDRVSIARGRLARRSNGAAIAGAAIDLIRSGAPTLRRGRTDERGDFVVALPAEPATDGSSTGPPAPLAFRLEFTVPGHPPHRTNEQHVDEGRAVSIGLVRFPTL